MNIFGDKKPKNEEKIENGEQREIIDDKKMLLREEELDISKNRVQVGDVEISKEIVEEPKVVDVPVCHEEVVIERRVIDKEPSDSLIGAAETIHIPVSEEHVEVGKHTVVTGEISARKREKVETRQINEKLQREEARVHSNGDPNIVADETEEHLH